MTCTSTTNCRLAGTDLFQGIADQRQVARQDAVAGVTVGRADAQHRRIALERRHVLEGGEPHRLGDLCTEQLGHRCPQLIMVAHLHLLSSLSFDIHTIVHIMWTSQIGCKRSAR